MGISLHNGGLILSLSTDQKVTPGWCNIQGPRAVVLVLNLKTIEYILPEFIKEMKNLKVLIVTNYGFCTTELKNLELLGSLLSLKRIRLQQVSVPSLCDLKNVHKLSLYMCEVENAFENSSIDFSEAMPKLEDLSIEYCKDLVKLPTGLFNIAALRNLTISNCHKFIGLPEEIEKLEKLKLLRISYCADIEEMPKSITKLKSLSFLDMSFCVSLKRLPEEIGELQNLKKLYMAGCPVLELPKSITDVGKLESVICDEYAYPLWEVIKYRFSGLSIKTVTMEISLNWLS
ncbi:probable disease resistance protein At5g66900 isoform X1 [Prosopis cineraria]|uniref:probable disease resistance protein At5g66900 isoform X1 n=1 Tax=Prosopis cineraria TaxID=364024 RepID=UPI00241023EC|nr:probable disease resistance protein At5g66900 isoform X1 [Prosopis cineraria]XP_054784878.1 probable disease resistance protein At5g66900 isoform X1 [Prosopis cineraria]